MKRLNIEVSKTSGGISMDEGLYTAKIKKMERDEKGDYGPQIKWTFTIMKGKYKKKDVLAWSSLKATPKNKTGRWLKRLMKGFKFKNLKKFDISDLMGEVVTISIAHSDKVNDDGSPKSKVDEIFAKKKKKDKKKKKKKKEEEEEEDDDDEEEEEEGEEEEEEDEDDDDEDDEDDDEEEEEEEEEPKKKKKKKKKGKDKKKKKKKKKKSDDDDEDDDEDEELNW